MACVREVCIRTRSIDDACCNGPWIQHDDSDRAACLSRVYYSVAMSIEKVRSRSKEDVYPIAILESRLERFSRIERFSRKDW